MKEELMRQRQLVDQLRQAHAQIQQHAQPVTNGPTPTLSDLEQLRNELREELDHREHAHRQELESFKRQQQSLQKQQLVLQSQQSSPIEQNELKSVTESKASNAEHQQQGSYHQSNTNQQHSSPVRQRRMQRSSGRHIFQQQRQRDSFEEVELESGSQSTQPVFQSMQTKSEPIAARASLQCDSKLVYFDGHVRTQQEDPQEVPPRTTPSRKKRVPELQINLEDSVDDLVSRVSFSHNVALQQQPETSSNGKSQHQSFNAPHRREDNNQEEVNESMKALAAASPTFPRDSR
uniref:Uncharacterized protein n=1 Tax=Globisporangium ultimum (strain ATCC 200006 / CBS 805.95 / DAOM BR144) TaxID=431595 RepID=K3WND5_GLOUD